MVAHELDVSSRSGLLLGAFYTGVSFQPGLLSRATRDQAIISGVAAATGYGWGVTAHSLLSGISRKIAHSDEDVEPGPIIGTAVDLIAAVGGAAAVKALPAREHDSTKRSLLRLGAMGLSAAGASGLGGHLLQTRSGHKGSGTLTLVAALGTAAAAYALTKPEQARAGALDTPDGKPHEDVAREINMPQAVGSSLAVTALLMVIAKGESALSGAASRGAARILGGDPDDHRTLGRLVSTAITAGVGWGAVTGVSALLAKGGEGNEPAHAVPPQIEEITGGPGSLSSWADQSRESRRWLSMVLTPEEIENVMGGTAQQPIRVYGSLKAADSPQARAELLLAEIDRTKALERSVFVLFSPTGSGYVNYVASETLEYLTHGDCASACIQYSVLPSALSLTKVPYATSQTRIVLNGIMQRLMAMPKAKRPKFYMFGESLGSQVSEEVFRGQGLTGPEGVGLDAAVWIGTPAATVWRDEIWGTRTVTEVPEVGPGSAYLPRAIRDWRNLPAEDKKQVKFLLLQNGDDPIPKFGAKVLWQQPSWLGPDETRPPGSPRGTKWLPVVTFFATFIDMQNALVPTPGTFQEGGHDYRREIPEAIKSIFGFKPSAKAMASVQKALRDRELEWEVRRDWMAAEAKPAVDRAKAEAKVEAHVTEWTGHEVDAAEVARIAEGN